LTDDNLRALTTILTSSNSAWFIFASTFLFTFFTSLSLSSSLFFFLGHILFTEIHLFFYCYYCSMLCVFYSSFVLWYGLLDSPILATLQQGKAFFFASYTYTI
jgi:hypothetical protein